MHAFTNLGHWQVNITTKMFESTGVTVIMHWWLTVENNISYNYLQSHSIVNINVTVIQQAKSIQAVNFTERTSSSVQFNVFYDTLYNITLAEVLCDQSNVISLIELYFNESKLIAGIIIKSCTVQCMALHACPHVYIVMVMLN